MRPSLFLAVRDAAQAAELSMPVYILAHLHETFLNETVFDLTPEQIRRKVRG